MGERQVKGVGPEMIDNTTTRVVDGGLFPEVMDIPTVTLRETLRDYFVSRMAIVVHPDHGFDPGKPFVYFGPANREAELGWGVGVLRLALNELEVGKKERVNLILLPNSNTWMESSAETVKNEFEGVNVLPASKDLKELMEVGLALDKYQQVLDIVEESGDPGNWDLLRNDDNFEQELRDNDIGVIWVTPYVDARLQGRDYKRPVFIKGVSQIQGERLLIVDDALAQGVTLEEVIGGLSKYEPDHMDVAVSLSKRKIQDKDNRALNALDRATDGRGALVEAVAVEGVQQVGENKFLVKVNGGLVRAT